MITINAYKIAKTNYLILPMTAYYSSYVTPKLIIGSNIVNIYYCEKLSDASLACGILCVNIGTIPFYKRLERFFGDICSHY